MPVVPTVSGRQVESIGVNAPEIQSFQRPNIGDVAVKVGGQALDVFAQAKQRADVAMSQDASLQLTQAASDLMTNPQNGLLNLQGKNALGKGQEYTQLFDAKAQELSMQLPESARSGFMQQAQQQRIQFTSQAGRHEISQLNAYEQGQFQATLDTGAKTASEMYGDNTSYVLANRQAFQQIDDFGAAHGWSDEQIQAKKVEFKEKVADRALSQWSASNSIEFIQSNGELSDTVTGSRRATLGGGESTGEGARGIRNNNPGNLEFSASNPWVGQTGDDGRFAKFETPEHGIRALGRNLLSYQRQGIDTVSDIINRWAPASDNNDTDAYIRAVCAQVGVTADQPIDASNPNTLKALCAAIIHHENGSQPYSNDQLSTGVSAALGLSQLPASNKRYTVMQPLMQHLQKLRLRSYGRQTSYATNNSLNTEQLSMDRCAMLLQLTCVALSFLTRLVKLISWRRMVFGKVTCVTPNSETRRLPDSTLALSVVCRQVASPHTSISCDLTLVKLAKDTRHAPRYMTT